MLGPVPWGDEHRITAQMTGLMGGMAHEPMARGFGNALNLERINRQKCCIAGLACFHFDKNDQSSASCNKINLTALRSIGGADDAPAQETQPEARKKFSLDAKASGAATIRAGARRAQPSPPSASADNWIARA